MRAAILPGVDRPAVLAPEGDLALQELCTGHMPADDFLAARNREPALGLIQAWVGHVAGIAPKRTPVSLNQRRYVAQARSART